MNPLKAHYTTALDTSGETLYLVINCEKWKTKVFKNIAKLKLWHVRPSALTTRCE